LSGPWVLSLHPFGFSSNLQVKEIFRKDSTRDGALNGRQGAINKDASFSYDNNHEINKAYKKKRGLRLYIGGTS